MLNAKQSELHKQAVSLSRSHRKIEAELVAVLQKIEEHKVFKALGFPSLFTYAKDALGLSESVAYSFIAIARKARQVSALQKAVAEHKISVAKASRIVSALNVENADELIVFAQTHSTRETDFEVARRQPKSAGRDRARVIAEDLIRLEFLVSTETYAKLQRAMDLLATSREDSYARVLDQALESLLDRRDPVRKAERSQRRREKSTTKISAVETVSVDHATSEESRRTRSHSDSVTQLNEELCANRVSILEKSDIPNGSKGQKSKPANEIPPKRKPLTAEQKHAVFARDGGRCTHVNEAGQRCTGERWLHIHHIIPVSQGGGNEPENLTTLCSFHHDLVHQLSLPIEGQVSWIRQRAVSYSVA